jgi:anti-anti-sigma regulatory factor
VEPQVTGDSDLIPAPDILDVVLHAHDGNASVIIDFTNATFVGADGINLLVDARNRLRVTGDYLLVHSPAPLLTRMLAFFGLTDMIYSAGTSHTTRALTGVAKPSRDEAVPGRVIASPPNNPFAASAVLIDSVASRDP